MEEIAGIVFLLNTAGNTIAQQELLIQNLQKSNAELIEMLNQEKANNASTNE